MKQNRIKGNITEKRKGKTCIYTLGNYENIGQLQSISK